MSSSRPSGGESGPPRRRGRETPSYEAGLRSLGDQIGGPAAAPPAGPPVPNEGGLRSLGDQIDPARRGGRERVRGAARRGVAGGADPKDHGRHALASCLGGSSSVAPTATPVPLRPDPQDPRGREDQQVTGQPFNMLVIGSDTRVGDKKGTSQYGTSTEVGGQRSDVLMIWHVAGDEADHGLCRSPATPSCP